MSAYVVFQGDIEDLAGYEEYKILAAESVDAHGGTYLVRGGPWVSFEGEPPPSRNVIIRFPTMEAAQNWYNSESYAQARPLRQAASTGALYVIEG
ncbi:MAG: DUF1330 domain-containing protein [Acidimicrobiales bacterium]|jgi:uncharacterized protein (DUF1330 family)|nr:DUF1330 domain-containing protein [Acidimicrobiales bacterium]